MFGAGGSFIDFTAPQLQAAFVAQRTGAHRAAVLPTTWPSPPKAASRHRALHRYHIATPVIDTSIPYGVATLDADVTRMQQDGVDFVATCMDATGNIKLSQTLQQHGINPVTQYWLSGYDQQTLQRHTAAMQGVYFLFQQTPFEATALDPGTLPGDRALNAGDPAVRPRGTLPSSPGPGRMGERRPVRDRAPGAGSPT